MHSSKTWTTKDASIRTANAPRFTQLTQFHAQHIPTPPRRSGRAHRPHGGPAGQHRQGAPPAPQTHLT